VELADKLTTSAFVVARMLEGLHASGEVERVSDANGGPLLWLRASRASRRCRGVQTSKPKVVALVDLGNTHDCLQRLVPLAEAGVVLVRAYADCSFSGYGVRPPLIASNCVVVQADGADRNAADVELIWDVVRLCTASAPDERYIFIVATKDQGFRHLKRCVESSGCHVLNFVANWPALEAALAAVA